MKKILTRVSSLCLVLSLLAGLFSFASAIEPQNVPEISVNASAALLVDLNSGQVLYEQNADERRYPASTTKIMTALLTIEAIGRGELTLDTVITAPAAALHDITSDSSTANIVEGEQITVKNLLYCLMLPSANEAANIFAITLCGDIPTFVDRMNTRAQELGMANTHFANPHGLHNADHYTTARDLYTLAKQAMTHPTFQEIVSTGSYTIPATNLSEARVLFNTNALLTAKKYPGYTYSGTIGIKTGSTPEAGYCLVAAAKKSGRTLLSVVLGAQNPTSGNNVDRQQFSESKKLLEWGFTNFNTADLLNKDTYLQEIPLRFSLQASHVVLQPSQSISALIPGEFNEERLELRLKLNAEIASAPVTAGDVLGSVTVIYDGEAYATVDMVATSDVSFSAFMAFVSAVNTVFGNTYIQLLLLLALLFFLFGLAKRFLSRRAEVRKLERKEKLERKRQEAQERHRREHHPRTLRRKDAEQRTQKTGRSFPDDRPPIPPQSKPKTPPPTKRTHRPNNRR